MKANELRIGNIITDQNGQPCKILFFLGETMATVDSPFVGFPTDDQRDISIEKSEPIPLTEDWFIRLGFTAKDSPSCLSLSVTRECDIERQSYSSGNIDFDLISHDRYDYGGGYVDLKETVKYVHQLQNLYFALTGEELTLKEAS